MQCSYILHYNLLTPLESPDASGGGLARATTDCGQFLWHIKRTKNIYLIFVSVLVNNTHILEGFSAAPASVDEHIVKQNSGTVGLNTDDFLFLCSYVFGVRFAVPRRTTSYVHDSNHTFGCVCVHSQSVSCASWYQRWRVGISFAQ
jgi:hypothetical protein